MQAQPMQQMREKARNGFNGGVMLLLGLGGLTAAGWFAVKVARTMEGRPPSDPVDVTALALAFVCFIAAWFILKGLISVNPNEAVVLQLFGRYTGSLKKEGLRWVNPLYRTQRLSVRAHSFESTKLKVNDFDGNPIEIAAIVVYRVRDTAQAVFSVDDYHKFVYTQTEAALRNLASRHPYDGHDDQPSLRRNTGEMALELADEIQAHITMAGVTIEDAKVSHLAYAQEIAQAMLQRQQASAIIAARTRIVEGAVGMVQLALERLAQDGIVKLDEASKAKMVANLLVVLCGERAVQPIVNTSV